MRTAVVYYGEKHKEKLKDIAEGLASGLENQGARVDIIDVKQFSGRLSIYQFIAFGTETSGTFGGKIPPQMESFLKKAEARIGTRAYAFVPAKGLRTGKSLLSLMKAVEREGLFLVYSDLLENRDAAAAAGRNLNVKPV